MSDDKNYDEYLQEMGRRIAAAVVSMQLGVKPETVYKRFRGQPVGAAWLALAQEGVRQLSATGESITAAMQGPKVAVELKHFPKAKSDSTPH